MLLLGLTLEIESGVAYQGLMVVLHVRRFGV
jgi:hypothetical protein